MAKTNPTPLSLVDVERLRSLALRFGQDAARRKHALLLQAARRPIVDAATLASYHDCLLFVLAYPDSTQLRGLARRELGRVAGVARTLKGRARRALAGSGIAWSDVTIAFSYDIASWLAARHPRHAEIDSFADGGLSLSEVLAAVLPPLEFEMCAPDHLTSAEILERAARRHPGTRLSWLVATLARLPSSSALRATVWDALEAYTTVSPRGAALSRTFARGLPVRAHFHREPLQKHADARSLVDAALPRRRPLTRTDRRHLLDVARATLAMLGRETDAITLADEGGVRQFDLERGVSIALYSMRPDARPPLDSHVGFVLFKNRLPIAYGGGWPFLGACRIGVNVFAPYRGGESPWLFCQVLRTYRQRFAIDCFVVEPYQFGAGNPEGIRSGAFWFYYRLGFRPVDDRLAEVARSEFARMAGEPGYRSPAATLRRFARDDIAWQIARPRGPRCEPSDLSRAVTAWIDARHRGDRAAAEEAASRTVARSLGFPPQGRRDDAVRRAWRGLCPLLAQIPDLARWPAHDKAHLRSVVLAKPGDEARFFRRLAAHARLRRALCAIAAAAPA